MKKKQDDKFFDEYMQKRKNSCFYSEISSESLLVTKIWDFNKTILEKWSDVNLINSTKTNIKMKKGLKNIANNLREIVDKLDKAAEAKECIDIINLEK